MPNRRPNIVLLQSDQHRPDWMGCAGFDPARTPNLDRLAAQGTRFTQAYCNYPLCGPSRMSMLTGRHPCRNSVWINEHTLNPDVPTVAHALGRAGYETVLCGRMHFMSADQRHGYQRRLVGDICRCYAGGPQTPYPGREGSASSGRKALEHTRPGDSPVLQYDRDVTAAAERFCRERADGDDDRPVFLTVGWYGPHHPFTAPPDLYEQARDALDAAGDAPAPVLESPHPWWRFWFDWQKHGDIPPELAREVRANYAGMIAYVDRLLGRVLQAAEQLPGETVVVYTSDHGEMACDRQLTGKCCFYEPSIRVPWIVAPLHADESPVPIAPGATVDVPVSLLDLCPTLVEWTGAPELPIQDGNSLAALAADPVQQAADHWASRPVLAEMKLLDHPPARMVRRGDLKLTYYHTYERPELYDLPADPWELRDLAVEPGRQAEARELLDLVLADWDPADVNADADRKSADLAYMAQWGREVGMGRLELWTPGAPGYDLG